MLRVGDQISFLNDKGATGVETIIGIRDDTIALTDKKCYYVDERSGDLKSYPNCFIAMFREYDPDIDKFIPLRDEKKRYNKNCWIVEDGDPAIHEEYMQEQYE